MTIHGTRMRRDVTPTGGDASPIAKTPGRTSASPFDRSTIGVLGPTRLNYARIVPMVDYTARVIERMLAPERG